MSKSSHKAQKTMAEGSEGMPTQDAKNNAQEPRHEESSKAPSDAQKIAELTQTLQRLQAEFENAQKRMQKEKQQYVQFACAQLIERMLPLLDTFDSAIKNAKKESADIKGMEMVRNQLLSVLSQDGLTPIECVGKPVDSNLHDIMLSEESQKEEGTILEEFQKGYLMHGKVLRHSKVKVSSRKAQQQ